MKTVTRNGVSYTLVSTGETLDLMRSDSPVVLLDVRTEREHHGESGHLEHALLIPVQELERRLEELASLKSRTIIAYCRSGNRSGVAAAILAKNGFTAMNMEGGILKWNAEKLPVVRES